MTFQVRQIHPLFVGEVSGIDLTQPQDARTIAAVNAAMDQYAVLVFRNERPLTQDEQMAFTLQLGPLDLGLKKMRKGQPNRFKYEAMIDIGNVDATGEIADRSSRKIASSLANQIWHSDSSFQDPAARYSLLSAVIVPPEGGQTEYCDLRAAYDALPDKMKQRLDGLVAEHFALHSRMLLGDRFSEEEINAIPPAHWPVVRTHAGSGRKLLFIGAHAHRIEGMPVPEGRMLLMDLLEHATQPQFVYRHEWRVGDLVMWDNRSTLHRGRPYDFSERRELRRTTTLDVESAAGEGAAA